MSRKKRKRRTFQIYELELQSQREVREHAMVRNWQVTELGSEAERSFRAQRREDAAGSCQGQPGPDCRLCAEESELGGRK